MDERIPDSLALIAGKGVYPLELAASAKKEGVKRLAAVAFRGETDRRITALVDEVIWVRLGQLEPVLDAFKRLAIRHAVMVGQITPTHIFRIRLDRAMLDLLARLPVRNAETVFGAVGDELNAIGVELLPCDLFMRTAMPAAGPLTAGAPTSRQQLDIELGQKIAKFFRDYKSEVKKIVWPGPRDVVKNTVIVLIMCAVVGAFIWLVDYGLGQLLKLILGV